MRFKFFSVVIIGLAFFQPVTASESLGYEQVRSRVLAMNFGERYHAVKTGMDFDTQTVIGKYFYNTVVAKTPGALSRFSLSQRDLHYLRDNHPKYYLEHEILNTEITGLAEPQIEAKLASMATQAKQQNWMRLYRLVMAKKVAALRARGLTFRALHTVRQMVKEADSVDVNTAYDYPLTRIYADLAGLYRQGGNYPRSQRYCQKLQQALTLADSASYDGILCESMTLHAIGEHKEALKLANTVLTRARDAEDGTAMMTASYVIAQSYNNMGNPALAKRFAQEGLTTGKHFPTLHNGAMFKLLSLLLRLALDADEPTTARYYLSELQNLPLTDIPLHLQVKILNFEGDVAHSEENYKLSAALYRQLLEQQRSRREQELKGIAVTDIDVSLDDMESSYIKTRALQEDTHSRNMTVLALFTTAISIVCAVAVYRLYKHKVMIESFTRVDQLTSVDNRWFALKAIRQYLNYMERSDDKACLAILDIDHFTQINSRFGHETGDKVLAHIAKVCKYQLRREDLIGRYGGEEFILLLVGTELSDAVNKIDELRQAVASQPLPELADTPLKFSCGLVEVTDNAQPDDVIALCSTLLSTAKERGRNKTCFSSFRSPEQAECV